MHVQRRGGFLSYYFDHLLFFISSLLHFYAEDQAGFTTYQYYTLLSVSYHIQLQEFTAVGIPIPKT